MRARREARMGSGLVWCPVSSMRSRPASRPMRRLDEEEGPRGGRPKPLRAKKLGWQPLAQTAPLVVSFWPTTACRSPGAFPRRQPMPCFIWLPRTDMRLDAHAPGPTGGGCGLSTTRTQARGWGPSRSVGGRCASWEPRLRGAWAVSLRWSRCVRRVLCGLRSRHAAPHRRPINLDPSHDRPGPGKARGSQLNDRRFRISWANLDPPRSGCQPASSHLTGRAAVDGGGTAPRVAPEPGTHDPGGARGRGRARRRRWCLIAICHCCCSSGV